MSYQVRDHLPFLSPFYNSSKIPVSGTVRGMSKLYITDLECWLHVERTFGGCVAIQHWSDFPKGNASVYVIEKTSSEILSMSSYIPPVRTKNQFWAILIFASLLVNK